MNIARLFLLAPFAVLAGMLLVAPGAVAGKWQTVHQGKTDIMLEDWPDELPCTYRAGGYDDSYATKRSSVYCPRIPSYEGDRTFIRVLELQPGYYWRGGYSRDVRQHPVFQRKKGYFAYFKSAVFPEGQDFECYSSTRCGFRNIRFAVAGKSCQLVHYNPDIGTTDGWTGRGEAPYSVLLIHCGAAKPFARHHFQLKPGKATITFPGAVPGGQNSAVSPGDDDLSLSGKAEICRFALNGELTAWQELGFREYVDVARRRGLSVADCRRVLESAAETAAKADAPAAPGSGFANCFDNPQACK